ncbi:MAG: arginase family protein [Hyphomicrobiales bacterium]
MSERDIHDAVLEGTYWWGIPTLLGAPHDADLTNCDIALVGVPHSTGNGTTERDQHLGPRAVRNVSPWLGGRVHSTFGIDPWQMARICDVGDVAFPQANNNEHCIAQITDYYERLDAASVRPVSIGGDHSITGGILMGLGGEKGKLTGGQKASLLHLDAHTDTFDMLDHFLGAKRSAAHWGSYLVKEGYVDASRSIQIGLRGHNRSLDWLQSSYDLGYEVVTMERYREMGAEAACRLINETLGDGPVYVTFDLDCLDPTIAPAVSNLEPGVGGFSIDEANQLLRCVKGKNIIGGDVVCLMPTKDQRNNITSMVASTVLFEIMSLVAAGLPTK